MRKRLFWGVIVVAATLALPSPARAADLSVTAANVSPGTNSVREAGVVLEAVTAGQVLYKRASDGKFGLCDNNGASLEIRTPYGIAINNAAANQGVVVHTQGRLNIGATVVVGTAYWTSATPGAISNATADATTGKWPGFVGFAIATTTIDVQIKFSGVAVP